MSSALLPPQSTEFERVMADLIGKYMDLPAPNFADFWDPYLCPLAALPQLAWAYSVDQWDDAWSEQVKRDVCAAAFAVHRHKGTIGAVRRALGALGFAVTISEWFEHGGEPGTFRLDAYARDLFGAGYTLGPELVNMIAAAIDHVKPASRHYDLRVGEAFETGVAMQSAMRERIRDRQYLTVVSEGWGGD